MLYKLKKPDHMNWIFRVTYKPKACFKHTQTNVPQRLSYWF